MTVLSGADVKFNVSVSNSKQGYLVKAEQTDGMKDIRDLISVSGNRFIVSMPKNTTGQDQSYRITVYSKENENIVIEVFVTVKHESSSNTPTDPTEPTEPSTKPTEPSTEPTEPSTDSTEPSTEQTEPFVDSTEPTTD